MTRDCRCSCSGRQRRRSRRGSAVPRAHASITHHHSGAEDAPLRPQTLCVQHGVGELALNVGPELRVLWRSRQRAGEWRRSVYVHVHVAAVHRGAYSGSTRVFMHASKMTLCGYGYMMELRNLVRPYDMPSTAEVYSEETCFLKLVPYVWHVFIF